MLLSKTVIVNWNSKIKKHYVNKGYVFTHMGDTFEVDIQDLTKGSNVLVECMCDYCGKIYTISWYRYLEGQSSCIKKDCCNSCKSKKIVESVQYKYGKNSIFQVDEIKEHIAKTNLEKYGVENPFASGQIKEKIKETNLERYGVENPLQNSDILAKVSQTCHERYGVDYYVMTQRFSKEKSPRWKGGVATQRNARLTYDYRKWRKAVFDRDSYTCQCCEARTGNGISVYLNAHHIFNWKDYPELRYDVHNGITLCQKCHNMFHQIYGKNFNSKEQIEDFLSSQGKKIC